MCDDVCCRRVTSCHVSSLGLLKISGFTLASYVTAFLPVCGKLFSLRSNIRLNFVCLIYASICVYMELSDMGIHLLPQGYIHINV